MPIRKEHRALYGAAWRQFRLQLIEQAGGQICSKCGIELAQGINAAHLDHNPKNPKSVVLLCPSCHAANDARHCLAIQRRRKAASDGQQWLLPELEWAPYAAWEIPGWIYDRLHQMTLDELEPPKTALPDPRAISGAARSRSARRSPIARAIAREIWERLKQAGLF